MAVRTIDSFKAKANVWLDGSKSTTTIEVDHELISFPDLLSDHYTYVDSNYMKSDPSMNTIVINLVSTQSNLKKRFKIVFLTFDEFQDFKKSIKLYGKLCVSPITTSKESTPTTSSQSASSDESGQRGDYGYDYGKSDSDI